MITPRLKHWGTILFPVALSLLLYRRSFRIWFLADDFAWLGLRLSIYSMGDLLAALFRPMAQGTIRTLSERLFFLGFESGFGLESLPMRVWMFLTLAVAEVLLVLVARRLTGSLSAGVLAASLWAMNFGVTVAMSWLSTYNQILLSALVLGALYCFIRYFDTGRKGFLVGAWVCYLLGFGALESIVVLPGILLAWALLLERRAVRTSLPFFGPAIAFTAAHLWLIPKTKQDPSYLMHFDGSLGVSLGVYWQWLLGADKIASFGPDWAWLAAPALWILTPAVLGFTAWRGWRRDFVPLFGVIVSLALIAPMLPLRDHRTDYYVASASLGIMMVLASIPSTLPGGMRWLAAPLLLLYVFPSLLVQNNTFEWYLQRTGPGRVLLRGVQYAVGLHPGKLILLEGIDQNLYASVLADDALRLVNGGAARLAPGSGIVDNGLVAAPAAARAAFEKDAVVVYRLNGARLKDVTREWERGKALALSAGLSPEIRTGDPVTAQQLGEGWSGIEAGNRWMGARATLRLGGPFASGAKISLAGFGPEDLGPAVLTMRCNGNPMTSEAIAPGALQVSAALPAACLGPREIEVELGVSKTFHTARDKRELSLVVAQIGIR